MKGHAFHYSTVHPDNGVTFGYELNRGFGINETQDGLVKGNVIGSYTHIHPVPSRLVVFIFVRLFV